MSDETFDHVLRQIMRHSEGCYHTFLDVIFSFLYRRTQFFRNLETNCEGLGLPSGLAEEMVKKICRKYLLLEVQKGNDIISDSPSDGSEPVYLQECREEIVETTEMEPELDVSVNCTVEGASLMDKPECQEINEAEYVVMENADVNNTSVSEMYYDSNPECYNGALYEGYSWSQTIYDLDIQIKVPNYITNGKQVSVHISHTHLKAEVLKGGEWEVVLDGQLSSRINTEGSVWTLDCGHHIHVHLEKAEECFWEALLEGEPKINMETIDCVKRFEDLREEEQAKIQEVLYDHHQKSLGKPTTKESKVHEILKEAWNKENSPFKGQKFDPNQFTVMG